MQTTTGDELRDEAKQSSLDYIRETLNVLFSNQTEDANSIVNDTVLDVNPGDVDTYIRQLVYEHDLPIKCTRLSFKEVRSPNFYMMLCDYVAVNKVSPLNNSYIHFLESSDFAVTIISLDLEDDSTRLRIEPLEMSPEFLKAEWRRIVETKRKGKHVNPLNIPGIMSGSELLRRKRSVRV